MNLHFSDQIAGWESSSAHENGSGFDDPSSS